MSDYPLPDWTRAEIEAWEEAKREARLMPIARAAVAKVLGVPVCARCGTRREDHATKQRCRGFVEPRVEVPCAACEKSSDAVPLTKPSRIRFSAKFKGRVFEVGAVLCHRHSVEEVKA